MFHQGERVALSLPVSQLLAGEAGLCLQASGVLAGATQLKPHLGIVMAAERRLTQIHSFPRGSRLP